MDAETPPQNLYTSPKRKRGEAAPGVFSPVVSPSSTLQSDLPCYPFSQASADNKETDIDGSPRSKIADRLQRFHLGHDGLRHEGDHVGPASKRLARTILQDESSSSDRHQTKTQKLHFQDLGDSSSPKIGDSYEPVSSLIEGTKAIQERPQRNSRSPSLDGELADDNFWHENEITGHQPSDPADDGYGLNGLGFVPTPSMAWSRSQRRKQQVADYRSREARDARQRRSERRKLSSSTDLVEESERFLEERRVRVHFENN